MRGIVPKGWTFRNQEVQDKVEPIPGSDFDEVDPDGHFFLDGSGGEHSKDPRTRVCGWAWVQPAQSATYPAWPMAGQYGTSPGKQTVPRAEMRALLQLLTKLEEDGHTNFNARVYTDSALVFKGYNKGPTYDTLRMGRCGKRYLQLMADSGPKGAGYSW